MRTSYREVLSGHINFHRANGRAGRRAEESDTYGRLKCEHSLKVCRELLTVERDFDWHRSRKVSRRGTFESVDTCIASKHFISSRSEAAHCVCRVEEVCSDQRDHRAARGRAR